MVRAVIFDVFGTLLEIRDRQHPFRQLLREGAQQGRPPSRNDLRVLMTCQGGDQPSLSNLCTSICSKLRSANSFEHADKQPLIDALVRILGIGEQPLVWGYLNKGTREEANREDFDAGVVEQVVQLLEGVNALRLRGP